MLANLIGWLATIFRASGMLARTPNAVKYLVSIGNLCWMINGFMTVNLPLIVSNAICLLIMLIEITKHKILRYNENLGTRPTKRSKQDVS